MEVIAVNAGNYNLKAKSSTKEIIFREKIMQNDDAAKFVLLDGLKYEIGVGEIDVDNLKHNSLVNKLCTLHAIAELAHSNDIYLVVCLPINQFKNKKLREEYRKSLIGSWEVTTEKGTTKFAVKECLCYMEGAAALLNYQNVFNQTIVNVVDIGGYNVNVAQFDKLHLVHGTEHDFDLGAYNLKSVIINDLNKILNVHIKEHELEHILKNPMQEQKEIINKHCISFINRLRNELKTKGYNLSLNNFLFTGGGSVDLQQYISQFFSNAYIGDIYDTVRGLYNLGVKKCGYV